MNRRAENELGSYFDDSVLTAKVKTTLLRGPEISGLAINVDTFNGTVQLSGFATDPQERQRAEAMAKEVTGVEEVRNDIALKQGPKPR